MGRSAWIVGCITIGACGGGAGGGDAPSPTADASVPPPPPAVCDVPVTLVDTSTPDHVVGDGTAASCTEAALRAAVGAGGIVTFACGPDPVTITVTSSLTLAADTVIDGGDTVSI